MCSRIKFSSFVGDIVKLSLQRLQLEFPLKNFALHENFMMEHKSTASYNKTKSIKVVTSLPLNKPIVILFRKIADKIDIDEAHCGGGGIMGGATFPPSVCACMNRGI